MNEAEHRIREFERYGGSGLIKLRFQLWREIGIYGKRHMADLVDRRFVVYHGFFALSGTELFDVEPVNQIAHLFQALLNALVIGQRFGSILQRLNRRIKFTPGTSQVVSKIELPACVKVLLGAS